MKKRHDVLRIGAGSSFADDRIAPAVELAERGELEYLVFECLAERTIARETLTRLKDPERGYTPYLAERFHSVFLLLSARPFASARTSSSSRSAPNLPAPARTPANSAPAPPGHRARANRGLL